jgi:MoxR-like ATPase
MEEKQVTIGETTYPLPDPFFVLATENPIEHEGTYALPEAELDRFFLKLLVTYPAPEEELDILGRCPPLADYRREQQGPALAPVLDGASLAFLRSAADGVRIDERLVQYIVSVVAATRPARTNAQWPALPGAARSGGMGNAAASGEGRYRYISFGASPRASLALYRCSRIMAFLEGRTFVSPEDVKAAALPVMRHRLVLSYEAEADGLDTDAVISRILAFVPIP